MDGSFPLAPAYEIATGPCRCRCGRSYLAGDGMHTEAECDESIALHARYRFSAERSDAQTRGLIRAGFINLSDVNRWRREGGMPELSMVVAS